MTTDLIRKTQFATVRIPETASVQGVPIGDAGGKCVGVRLYLNGKVLNTATNADTAAIARVVYYGDHQKQEHELLAGTFSKFIPCTDISQVYIRGNGSLNHVQVEIYLNEDQDELLIGV